MVDNGKISFMPAVDLSFLTKEEQQNVYEIIKENRVRITKAQAARLKEASQKEELSIVMITFILSGTKKNKENSKIVLKREKIRAFFDAETSDDEIEATILKLLKRWKEGGDAE